MRSEVGFEALTPAWRAWASRDQADAATLEAWLAESAAALAPPVDDHPGLQAALSVLGAATRGDTPPSFDEALLAVSRSLRAAVALTASPAAEGLVIEADGRAFHAPGIEPVDLRRRHAIRRVLGALARARRDRPGAVVRFDALVEAGWPGEKMRAEAARKRLRTATWQLRKLGLDGVLMTGEGGYFLDPDQPIEVG